MFQVGWKAAELERVKLQTKIQKEKSEIRRKKLESQLKMAGKAGGRGGLVKNPKKMKMKREQDKEDWLDDLVLETDPDKRQTSYSNLQPGGFVTTGTDRNTDTQTHRQTDRHDRKHYLPAYPGGNELINVYFVPGLECAMELIICFPFRFVSIGGSKGGARDVQPPPPGPKFFHFHAAFGKKLKNNSTFGSWRNALGKILDPPLVSLLNLL